MTVSIKETGDTCILTERTCSTSVDFPLPISKAGLVAALKTLLSDAERQTTEAGSVHIDRMRDGPRVCHGSANFLIRYHDACPLILEA